MKSHRIFAVLAAILLTSRLAVGNYYQGQIDRWTAQDSLSPPPDDAVVFVGSSSFVWWESMTRDLSRYNLIQRGFGGSEFSDLNLFVDDIVLPYDSNAIVVFEGSNDTWRGKSGQRVFEDYLRFVDLVHTGQDQARDEVPIFFLGITPTPDRWSKWSAALEANQLIKDHTLTSDALHYIDAPSVFLSSSPEPGEPPAADLFSDGLHLSAKGYSIWTDLITSAFQEASIPAKMYVPNPLHPDPGDRILIDFGPNNQADALHTASPDEDGNHWNNWHPIRSVRTYSANDPELAIWGGESLDNLVTAEGSDSGIDIVVTGVFIGGAAGKRDGGLLSPDPNLLGDFAIESATMDYFMSYRVSQGNQTGGFMLTGLDPTLPYDLRFFGSRESDVPMVTDYHVFGIGDPVTVSLQTSGDGIGDDGTYDGNDSQIAVAKGIRSDEFGQLFIDVDGDSRFYLNIFEISVGAGLLVAGDFTNDGALDIQDLDALTSAIQTGIADSQYDLDQSGLVDLSDRQHWVTNIKNTWMGDTNLDGVFDTSDLITALSSGEYEDIVASNSRWSTGDWNGDHEFTSADLITALADGGYEQGPRPAAVPEPSCCVLLASAIACSFFRRRKSRTV